MKEKAHSVDPLIILSLLSIPIDEIAPSRWQPRTEFAAEDLAELAASIATHGVLEPVIVRERPETNDGDVHVGNQYELIAGERRLRAARLAGLAEVPARLVDVDDATARAMTFEENLRRDDLDPIETARMLKTMLDAGDVAGQAELGKRLGMSQSQVSNHLRMLELPPEAQQRVRCGDVPPTHVRALLPYRQHPKLIEAVLEEVGKGPVDLSVEDFEWAVLETVVDSTCPLDGSARWEPGTHVKIPAFKPPADQLEALGVIEIPKHGYRKAERRVTNVELYEASYAEHRQKYLARRAARDGKAEDAEKGKPSTSNSKAPKPTAAELRRQQERVAEQWARRLGRINADWLRYLIAQKLLASVKADGRAQFIVDLVRLLVFLASDPTSWRIPSDLTVRLDLVAAIAKSAGRKVASRSTAYSRQIDGWDAAHELSIDEAARFAAGQFWRAEKREANHTVPHGHVASIAAYLGVDPEAAWRREQLGPLSESYWDAHTKDQLAALGEELRVDLDAGQAKSVAVKRLLSPGRVLPFPKELKRAKLAD